MQNPNQEWPRETPADNRLLGVQHRHFWASTREAIGTTEGSEDTVEKTAAGHRTSGTASHKGKITGGLQSSSNLENASPDRGKNSRGIRCQTITHLGTVAQLRAAKSWRFSRC
jgi:hypothetical protein